MERVGSDFQRVGAAMDKAVSPWVQRLVLQDRGAGQSGVEGTDYREL